MLNDNIRIDLHIHSKASEYKEAKGYVEESNINNINVLLDKLKENKINLFSITDHNNFDYELYKKLKESINKTPYEDIKNILPGVEFDVKIEEDAKTSCHIICIFNDEDDNKVKEIQNKVTMIREITNPDDHYSLKEFEDILYEIGISVLLIAHQRSALDNKNSSRSHHNFSDSVKDPEEWIKVGLINALEYQKPRVQGMIKNNLKEMNEKFATITGSDCHVWAAYPNKDLIEKEKNEYFSTVKCLPTFKGLVLSFTSMDTRFDRKDEGDNFNYISNIKIKDNKYELSTGINAIIGENGSGKSYILGIINNEDDSKYKEIDRINKVDVFKVGNPSLMKITQGEIMENVKKGTLFDNNSEYYDKIPTLEQFKSNIQFFVDNLKKYIESNIKRQDEINCINNTKIKIKEFNNIKNFYVSLDKDVDNFDNYVNERYLEINMIVNKLREIYELNQDFYADNKEKIIKDALNLLQELYNIVKKEKEEIDEKNRVISIVIGAFDELSIKIENERTSQEKEKESCLNDIRNFAEKIKKYLINNENIVEYPTFPEPISGISIKNKAGIKFIKEAKYHNFMLEDELYKYIFVQDFNKKEKIITIKTKEEYVRAVNGIKSYQEIETQLSKNKDRFINEQIKEETRVSDEDGTNEVGTTPGEIALTYYKIQLSIENEKDVILIDQPEDDISMKRIEDYLIKYFNSVRDKKQIIFVTHNPLLVVNLDVDNVIYISKDKKNNLDIKSGCLEDGNILDIVSENLDGGRNVVERRLKIYGTSEN